MGFLTPTPPPFEVEEWKRKSHLERIKPLAQDWALNGFGTPVAVYLLYVVKIALYAVGGLLLISATTRARRAREHRRLVDAADRLPEGGDLDDAVGGARARRRLAAADPALLADDRRRPLLAATGDDPAAPVAGEGAADPRRPADPARRGSLRRADRRLPSTCCSPTGSTPSAGSAGRLDPVAVGVLLALLGALGLRDKVPFLAARAEIYGTLAIIFLFPLGNMIVAAQLVFVCIWWGAASSKLNRHFPFVVTVMISNTPWNRSRSAKRRLYRDHPEDLRALADGRAGRPPGDGGGVHPAADPAGHQGGVIGTIAVAGMVIFHLHILSTFPLAVPLEWNVFMIFGVLFLFGHYGDVPFSTLDDPLLVAILAVICVGLPVLGNFRPDLVSFLPSMRYYAGNWATSQWLFRRDTGAEEKLDREIVKAAPIVVEQLAKFYDPEIVEVLLYKGLAFRSMHSHGRALNGLLPRAVDDVEDYDVREGELVAGVVLGYNFGDGHFHNHRLLEAVQERCQFEPGELRVVTLESQPAHVQRQRYRIFDAATGVVEEGWVEVADMVGRQPWLGDEPFPAHPAEAGAARPAAAAPPA